MGTDKRARKILVSLGVILIVVSVGVYILVGRDSDREAQQQSSDVAQPITEEDKVAAAYKKAWEVYPSFINGETNEQLSKYFSGDRLNNIPQEALTFKESQLRLVGTPETSPGKIVINSQTANFTDCFLDTTSNISTVDGSIKDGPDAKPRKIEVTMVKEDGVWKQARVVIGEEGSCEV